MDRRLSLGRRSVLGGLAVLPISATGQLALAATDEPDAIPITAPEEPKTIQIPDRVSVPILVYHLVKPGPPPLSQMARWLRVTPPQFDAQLAYLADRGYSAIKLGAIRDALEGRTRLPERPIIITFDDGWVNQHEYALPLLLKYGFTATFFVVAEFVDRPGFLSTAQLKEMSDKGMGIGSHSCTHPRLDAISPRAAWHEISASKQILETKLALNIDTFAYPYGAYNQRVINWIQAAGYSAARAIDPRFDCSLNTINALGGTTFDFLLRGR